jgi:uncharacterized membrane protein (DUF4010 family)
MARASRDPRLFRPAMAAALLASVATLVQLVLVTAVADTRVAWLLLPAAILGVAALAGEAAWLILRQPGGSGSRFSVRPAEDQAGPDGQDDDRWLAEDSDRPAAGRPSTPAATTRTGDGAVYVEGGTVTAIDFGAPGAAPAPESTVDEPTKELPHLRRRAPRALVGRRPFDLVPALLLTAILTVFLVISAVVEHALGPGAAVAAIAVAGLADAHAGALTAANLASQATLTTHAAVLATVAALAANTVVKLVLAHVAGGRRASTTLAALFALPTALVTIGLVVTLSVAN